MNSTTHMDTAAVENLNQLVVRSTREIEAHTSELGLLETKRYFIDQAAQLVAALRLWAQSHDRSDQVVREIIEAVDISALRVAAHELREMGTPDAKTASWTIALNTNRTAHDLLIIATTALPAL